MRVDQAVTEHQFEAYAPTQRGADAFTAINEEQEMLRRKAYAAAVESHALKPEGQRQEALEESARAKVRSHNVEPYDPVKNLDDAAREQHYEKAKLDAEQQEQALLHAKAKVREVREELAKLKHHEEPLLSMHLWLVVVGATMMLAGTLIPTICDALSVR